MIRSRGLLALFRAAVGGVFIYAGVVRIMDPLAFAEQIESCRVAGRALSFLAAVYLPWLQVFAGAFLVSGALKRAGALVAATVLAGFIGLAASALIRGLDADGLGAFNGAGGWLLLEHGVLLAMAAAVLFAPKRRA